MLTNTPKGIVDWLKENFQIVIDEEKYAINKNLLKVVEVSCYTSHADLQFNKTPSSGGSGVIYDIDDKKMYNINLQQRNTLLFLSLFDIPHLLLDQLLLM